MAKETIPLDKITKIEAMEVPKPQDDRTTAIMQLYFEQQGEQPVGFDFRCAHKTPPAGEDPWVRRVDVGAEWAPLDFGWLAGKAGVIAIENQAGRGRTTQPTDAEREATAKQIIEVSFHDTQPACIIRPGGFLVFEPVVYGDICIRCLAGGVPARLVVLPGRK